MRSRLILLVEDEARIRFSIRRFFMNHGYEVQEAESVAGAVEAYRSARPDVAILDHCLPDGSGLDLLAALRAIDSTVPIVILTAHASIDLAVRAIKEGAEQFLTKPVELPALLVVTERLIENQRNRQAQLAGKSRGARQAVDPFLGESLAIRRLAERARRVVASNNPILIQGETGTGKGLLAQWLHQNGPRADEAFLDLNCAGLTREFLETELFGHEKGAFTGALNAKPGLLEMAHRGAVFLDELGDMDLVVQAKLLKVVEDQRFRRLGAVRDRQVDVRLIAATHRDLGRLAEEQKFRGDLYYRISSIPLFVPALRERGGDVILLARSLLGRIATDVGRPGLSLSGEAERAIEGYAWRGNIRELRNVLERAALLSDQAVLGPSHLWDSREAGSLTEARRERDLSLDDVERRHITLVLEAESGNVIRTASMLGLSRSALYQKIKKHRIPLATEHD